MNRRTVIGVFSLCCLLAAIIVVCAVGLESAKNDVLVGILVRIGLVMGAIWLAWPQLSELVAALPKVVLVGGAIVLLAGVIYSRLVPIVILLVVTAIVLQLVYRFFSSRRTRNR